MSGVWAVYCTFPNAEGARAAARALLEEKHIACANIFSGVESLYRWQGELQQQQEAVMIAKTNASQVEAAIARLKTLHPYDVPCITASPVEKAYAPFAQWVAEETT